jgi:two-component system, NtrC family, sensor kinase
MEAESEITSNGLNHGHKKGYSRLYVRFVVLTLICSVLPLLLFGWGIYAYYSRFSAERMVAYFQGQIQHHRKLIELYLKERTSDLELVASIQSLAYLRNQENLGSIFKMMNREEPFFEDLGVLSDKGKHLAYVGPFDLMDKNYSQTIWFKQLMDRNMYISDMFLGYRDVPHFIIGITSPEGGERWILRATVNTESFRALVEDVKMGKTGEVFLVNREGILQTSPRFGGKILDKTSLPMEFLTEPNGIRILEASDEGPHPTSRKVFAYTWLSEPSWMLVVRQDYSEVFQQENHVNHAMLVFLHVSILAILIVSIITTRHMIQMVKKRDEQKEELNRQLVQTGKLASLGELAAGVAHEINNPLAIILAGNQVARDICDELPNLDDNSKAMLLDILSQTDGQVLRCNMITHNLLRFARRSKSVIENVNVNACLDEVVELMEKRAKSNGIGFQKDLDPNLPSFLSDPSQLQQVFVNLFSNAIDAHEGKPYGSINVATHPAPKRGGVEIVIADTGMGISEQNMERIFDPFFTTKTVGKGTGLGLSISYSIIKNLGGDIRVRSTMGKGTEFSLFLPFLSPEDFRNASG